MNRLGKLGAAAFALVAVGWLVLVAAGDGAIDASRAFLGLGYISGIALVVLVIVAVGWYLGGGRRPQSEAEGPSAEQAIVRSQLAIGAGLIVVGAVLGTVFGVLLEEGGKVSLAIATAVIGAGAALMPPGAAAGATARAAIAAKNDSQPETDDSKSKRRTS